MYKLSPGIKVPGFAMIQTRGKRKDGANPSHASHCRDRGRKLHKVTLLKRGRRSD